MARDRISQHTTIASYIPPASSSTAQTSTGAVDMANHRAALFIVQTGTLGSSATVDMEVKESATSGGSYTSLTPTKVITQLVKASNDNNLAAIHVRANELTPGMRYLKGVVTVGTAASLVSMIAIAENDRYEPASALNPAGVVEIVAA